MQTLRQQIEALPEQERSRRKSFYSDDEWDVSWELNARPFQIEPPSDDWRTWTILGGRRVGKTYAGEHWAIEKYFNEYKSVLCLIGHSDQTQLTFKPMFRYADLFPGEFDIDSSGHPHTYRIRDRSGTVMMIGSESFYKPENFRGMKFDYIWGDEIFNAQEIVDHNPLTTRFLFTEPTKLPTDTIISRAGDVRTM